MVYEDVILGSFPKEGPPYKILWLPLDKLTWLCLLVSSINVSLVIFIIERLWIRAIKKGNYKNDGMYTIILILEWSAAKDTLSALWIILSTPIEGNLPAEWFNRDSFKARKVLLFHWIVFCLVMTTAYL